MIQGHRGPVSEGSSSRWGSITSPVQLQLLSPGAAAPPSLAYSSVAWQPAHRSRTVHAYENAFVRSCQTPGFQRSFCECGRGRGAESVEICVQTVYRLSAFWLFKPSRFPCGRRRARVLLRRRCFCNAISVSCQGERGGAPKGAAANDTGQFVAPEVGHKWPPVCQGWGGVFHIQW